MKNALITGAAEGIGKAISIAMAKEGINVILADINEKKLKETFEKDIKGFYDNSPNKGWFLKLDVTNEEQIQQVITKVINEFGKLDILVNNAGVISTCPITELEESEWDRVINTNLKGTFLVTKWVLKQMKKQREGKIVNISSNNGKTGQKYLSHYASSKHGVIGFTHSAAMEVADYNILVNAVCPGPVSTKLHFKDLEMQERIKGIPKDELLKEECRSIPMKRIAQPEEIAQLVIFLTSEKNTYITGESINISGGLEVH